MNEEKRQRIKTLAEAAFQARLEYENRAALPPSLNLEERRFAFIELQLIKAKAVEAQQALDQEVGALPEPSRQKRKPQAGTLDTRWFETLFGARRP